MGNIVHAGTGAIPRAVDTVAGAQIDAMPEAVDELADKQAEDSRPSVLVSILKVLVDASAAFTPLHSAAGGLLKVVELFEVRHCSSLVVRYLTCNLPVWDRNLLGTNGMSRPW